MHGIGAEITSVGGWREGSANQDTHCTGGWGDGRREEPGLRLMRKTWRRRGQRRGEGDIEIKL